MIQKSEEDYKVEPILKDLNLNQYKQQLLDDEVVQFELLNLPSKSQGLVLEKIDPINLNKEKVQQWFTLKEDKKWMRMLLDGINPIDNKTEWCHLDKIDIKKHKNLLFRNNFINQDETAACISQYLDAGFIQQCSKGDLSAVSPVFTVVTPNKWRMVFDARGINKFFSPQKISLPAPTAPIIRKEDKFFAKIDLSNAFMHIPLHPNFQKWFGFGWDGNWYKFVKMPFGWNMAPLICQEIMARVVREIKKICNSRSVNVLVNVYYDDLQISAETFDQCMAAFNLAIGLLRSGGFSVNEKKSVTPCSSIEWIGFKVEQSSITLTQRMKDKIIALYNVLKKHFYSRQNTVPVDDCLYTVGNYLAFLGVLNFCARVVHGARPKLSKLMSTLPAELRVDVTHHADALKLNEQEFYNIKEVVTMMKNHQSLRIEVHDETFEIMTDASMSEQNGPILGFSNGFGSERTFVVKNETNEAFIQKFSEVKDIAIFEALAVYLAVKNFPFYRKNLIVWCDSQVVEYAYKNIASDNVKLTDIIENIRAQAAQKNMVLVIRPVRSKLNNADKPSREQVDINSKWNELYVENYLFPVTLKEYIDTIDNQNHVVQGKLATALNYIFKKDNAAYGLRKYYQVVLQYIDQIHGTNAHNLVNAIANALWIDKSLWDLQQIKQIIEILRSNGYTKKRVLEKIAISGRKPDWMIHGASDPEEEYERKDKNLKRTKKKNNLNKKGKVFFDSDEQSDPSSSSSSDDDYRPQPKAQDPNKWIQENLSGITMANPKQSIAKSLNVLEPIKNLPDLASKNVYFSEDSLIKIPSYLLKLYQVDQPMVDENEQQLNEINDQEILPNQYLADNEDEDLVEIQNDNNNRGDDDDEEGQIPQSNSRSGNDYGLRIPDSISEREFKYYDRYNQHLAQAQFQDETQVQEERVEANIRLFEDDDNIDVQIQNDGDDSPPSEGNLKFKQTNKIDVRMRLDGGETTYSNNVLNNGDNPPDIDPDIQYKNNGNQGPGSGPPGQADSSNIQMIPGSSLYFVNEQSEENLVQISSLKDKIEEQNKIIQNLNEDLLKEQEDSKQFQSLVEQYEAGCTKLVENLEDERTQNKKIQDDLYISRQDLDKLKLNISEKENEIQTLKRNNQEFQYLVNTSEDNISKLTSEVEDRDLKLKNLQIYVHETENQIQELKVEIQINSTNNSKAVGSLNQLNLSLMEKNRQLQDNLSQSKNINISIQQQIVELKQEKSNWKSPLQTFDRNFSQEISDQFNKKPNQNVGQLILENLDEFKIELSRDETPKTIEGCVWIQDFISQTLSTSSRFMITGIDPLAKWAASRLVNYDVIAGEQFDWLTVAGLSQYMLKEKDEMELWVKEELQRNEPFLNILEQYPDLAEQITIQSQLVAGLLRAIISDQDLMISPLSIMMLVLRTPRAIVGDQILSVNLHFWGSYILRMLRALTGHQEENRIPVDSIRFVDSMEAMTFQNVYDMVYYKEQPIIRVNSADNLQQLITDEGQQINVEESQYKVKTKHYRNRSDNVAEVPMQWQNVFQSANPGRIRKADLLQANQVTPIFQQNWNLGQKASVKEGDALMFDEYNPQSQYEAEPFNNSHLLYEEQKEEKLGQEGDPTPFSPGKNYAKNYKEKIKTYKFDQESPIQSIDPTKR